jgi:conserved oligomeric Golgi complex subunit 7
VESGAISANGAPGLYNGICDVFLQITSPFLPYQQRLSLLEADYLGVQIQTVANDVRRAVNAVSASDLASLQSCIEKLQLLSVYAFPLSEGAIARFELMNGGYGPTKALSVIDRVVSDHAGEVAMAIKTLSAAIMADEEHLARNMDEPHVLCAMEALKVAGSFRRGLRSLEVKIHERFIVLSQRMEAHSSREKSLLDSSNAPTSRTTFALPDSLSAVEIDSLITKSICGSSGDEEIGGSEAVLRRLTSVEAGVLFMEADEAARRLATSCHTFVFDVCSAVPRLQLVGMSSMPVWQKGADRHGVESYGTLPQNYITQIGEYMLSLVQSLEPFASDREALSLANEVMHNVRDMIAFSPWREFVSVSGSVQPDTLVRDLMEGKKLIDLIARSPPNEDEEEESENQDEIALKSEAFCDAWLDVVGLSITGRLLERIMKIPSLSPKGCDHLHADLNYLVNVLSALGISGHPHPLLSHFAELCSMNAESLVQQIEGRDRADPLSASLAAMEKKFANLRGIPTDR